MPVPEWKPSDSGVRPKDQDFLRPGLYYVRGSMQMTVPGRNDPCYCGGGKKYKKCHEGEKPRFRCVYIGYRLQFGGVRFEEGGDVLVQLGPEVWAPADHVITVSEAVGPDGSSKVLNVISDKLVMRLPQYLANNYDVVYAIDTNTKEIAGESVSVSCVVESRFGAQDGGERVLVDYRIHGVMVFRNCRRGGEEKFAWWRLLRTIVTEPGSLSVRVGLITDHDRNNHPAYNQRIAPFYGTVVLPRNATMLYATTDAATSKATPDVTNFLLDLCEKRAREVLSQFENTGSADIDGTQVQVGQIPDVAATESDSHNGGTGVNGPGVRLDWGEYRDSIPRDVQQRLEAGVERIRQARDAIARDAKVRVMPPIIIDPAVWNLGKGVAHAASGAWPFGGDGHEIGVVVGAGLTLCTNVATIRRVLAHEFAHCFETARRIVDNRDLGITEDLRGDPADEERERAMLGAPSDWLGEKDAKVVGWEDLPELNTGLQELLDAGYLPFTGPPIATRGNVLLPLEWTQHIRAMR